jgi:hypothetical protein
LDRILGNAKHDNVAESLKNAKANFEKTTKLFAKPSNPRPFPPLAPLAGKFVNPSFGEAKVTLQGDALVMEFLTSGAKFKLVPRDGDIFKRPLMLCTSSRVTSTMQVSSGHKTCSIFIQI